MKGLKISLVVITILIGLLVSNPASAAQFVLWIDWGETEPQDNQIDEIIVQFKDNGGAPVGEETSMQFVSSEDHVSKWMLIVIPPTGAVSTWICIDSELQFSPQEIEEPLPENIFETDFVPDE